MVAVGLDERAAATLGAAIVRARLEGVLPPGRDLVRHGDVAAALEGVAGDVGRTILVVDAGELDGNEAWPPGLHVVAVAGDHRPIVGVDDVVRRPVHDDGFALSLRLAVRSLSRADRLPIVDQMAELLRAGASGEIAVHAGVEGARIHVDAGRITWVHRLGHPLGLPALLAPAGITITEEVVREVVDECRRTRRTFGEILIAWSVVDRATLERCVEDHLRHEIAVIVGWPAARASFMEAPRAAITGASFDLATLAPSAAGAPPRARVPVVSR